MVPSRTLRLFLRAVADKPRVLVCGRPGAGRRGAAAAQPWERCGMRIAFDVSALTTPHSGVATYTRNLAEHLRSCRQDQILPMTHTAVLPRALNKTLWMQAVLPLQLTRVAPDVCHFTNSVASW